MKTIHLSKLLLFALAIVPGAITGQEVNITDATGRMWAGAKVTRIDATGITFHTALGGARPFHLTLEQLSKADQARYRSRVEAAKAAEAEKRQKAVDQAKERRAKMLEGTFLVPTAKGDVEGVESWVIEPSGLVVAFKTFIGEKRVALSDLTPEWQQKVKTPAPPSKAK